MEVDKYKVEVVHFINPHLIWIEVPDKTSASDDDFYFEQVGIYGVLPLEMTMDLVEDTLKSKRCTDWMPAATILMKKVFAESSEVYFCPIHIDNRSSIFDDNIHKYGEIIIKKHNGKYRLLSKLLVKSGYALFNEELFQDELSSGNIKTKLSHYKIKDIINQLEKKCQKQACKQTSVFQTAQRLESSLTVKNLKAHNERTRSDVSAHDMLERKLRDLQMCKEVDMESVGRATKKGDPIKESIKVEHSSLLQKKLQLLKKGRGEKLATDLYKQNVDDTVNKSARDENSEDKTHSKEARPRESIAKYFTNGASTKDLSERLPKDVCIDLGVSNKSPEVQDKSVDSSNRFRTEVENVKPQVCQKDATDEWIAPRKSKKPTKKKAKIPEYNIHTETRVMYGPPECNQQSLAVKIVPKEELFEKYDVVKKQEEVPAEKGKEDIYGNVDSDCEIEEAVAPKAAPKTSSNVSMEIQKSPTEIQKSATEETTPTSASSKPHPKAGVTNSMLKRKLLSYRENLSRTLNSSNTSDTSTKDSSTSVEEVIKEKTNTTLDSDDDNMSEVLERMKTEYAPVASPQKEKAIVSEQAKSNVNPFKNVDPNISVFVDKLVTPVLMVHSKMNKRFLPVFKIRDVPFNSHIQMVLKNMSVEHPMMLQTISWFTILRGYSTFMVSPRGSGKTLGYLPAVCRLVSDHDSQIDGVGPTCIIVCATANLVSEVENLAKIFLGSKEGVLAFYTGMDDLEMVTALLNGCDLLICTPPILARYLQSDFGVDLRRLTTLVLDDCERLSEVYGNEIKYFMHSIKEMLKTRVVKEVKVQYVLASRVWCEFMEPLAKKAPDTVICIGAFQECVLYSQASTTASFVTKENKINAVLEFLKQIDSTKRTVIVCRTDEEVKELEKALLKSKHVVFACDSTMTVQDLYNLRGSWDDYQEPFIGPILLCCDGNLLHMNITDAHYLVHYSLPHLFSMFCKRFASLNDNYASIFKRENKGVRIKILLEDTNVEQLPKILHFIRRCTTEVPEVLDMVCAKVLTEKDELKAKKLVPICDNLLALGECPDFWNCQERHAILKDYDEPKSWVPTDGVVTFKILHYHTATLYSARLLTNVTNGKTVKYPQNYNMLSMKISMYYTRESNRQLHGIPQVGDICAVSIRQNFFVRCQVIKILSYYQKGNPNYVLVKLIDEEKLERSRDINLYYLPNELKEHETHVVHVRLANIQPKDKDITFSELAKQQLKKITDGDDDLYLSGRVAMTVGNCVIVESLETCRDLTSVKKTVVRHDFRQELLEKHAIPNSEHLARLDQLCAKGGLVIRKEPEPVKVVATSKKLPKEQWAHLDKDDMPAILFASAENPSDFFVRLVKFEDSCNVLVKDIQKYVAQNTQKVTDIVEGDIVLAKLPDDNMFERARVDVIINNDKVKCFFVDQGDWREVSKDDLVPITEKFITQLPFQAIECRLIGVKPAGQNWTEFATNWFINCFEDKSGDLKQLYVKYFTKEKAQHTGGHKYGVAIIDTNSEEDVIINDMIMEVNLAQEEETEIQYLNLLDFKTAVNKEIEEDDTWEKVSKSSSLIEDSGPPKIPLADIFPKKPVRSVPLVDTDESDTSDEKWNINMTEDFMEMFRPAIQSNRPNAKEFIQANLPAIKPDESATSSVVSSSSNKDQKSSDSVSDTDSCMRLQSAMSDMQVIPTPKIKELDSDDLTSPEPTQVSPCVVKPDIVKTQDPLSKPKLLWRQNKNNVIVKIQLIDIEKYELVITERRLKFAASVNDTEYGFDLELYGVIDHQKSTHTNKGQYVLVNLVKILNRNWLTFTKSGGIQKWIVYDIDSIDVSSDEEEVVGKMPVDAIRNMCGDESESEDDDFLDDVNYSYS